MLFCVWSDFGYRFNTFFREKYHFPSAFVNSWDYRRFCRRKRNKHLNENERFISPSPEHDPNQHVSLAEF